MKLTLILLGALAVWSLFGRVLIALLFGKSIGAQALANQPDRIRLDRGGDDTWKNPSRAATVVQPLLARGFEDAGVYTVAEMPGLVVQLLVHSADRLLGCVYEHPRAGTWFEFACRYADGTSATFTTSRPTGLDPRPGHFVVHAPNASPLALWNRARAERPSGMPNDVSTGTVVRLFEDAYAEAIAWRKANGISTGEVTKVALRKAA